MSVRPLLACTTSGASSEVIALRSVRCRSAKDRLVRSIVTLGYFSMKASLRAAICSAWPPRTSWSHTVSVTSPSSLMSVVTSSDDVSVPEPPSSPGAHATVVASRAAAARPAPRVRRGRVRVMNSPGG
jgi:hypothetical protein